MGSENSKTLKCYIYLHPNSNSCFLAVIENLIQSIVSQNKFLYWTIFAITLLPSQNLYWSRKAVSTTKSHMETKHRIFFESLWHSVASCKWLVCRCTVKKTGIHNGKASVLHKYALYLTLHKVTLHNFRNMGSDIWTYFEVYHLSNSWI